MLDDIVSIHSLDIVALVETHIRPNDTDNMLSSITPPTYKLCHRPRTIGVWVEGLASLLKIVFHTKLLTVQFSAPLSASFFTMDPLPILR